MLEFTFSNEQGIIWTTVVPLTQDIGGGVAFDIAAAQFQKNILPSWKPGDKNVQITICGK